MSSSTTNSNSRSVAGLNAAGKQVYRRFLLVALLVLTALLSPLGASWLVLHGSNETQSLDEIVADQISDDTVLWGTAVHGDELEHRLALYKARQPAIVAMGSSRMEQFRQEFFADTFSCLCTIMGSIEDANPLIDALLAIHKPKHVILGIDYWWFIKGANEGNVRPIRHDPHALTLRKITAPVQWLATGRLSSRELIDLASGGVQSSVLPGYNAMGVAARVDARGVRADGSALHGDMIFTDTPARMTQDLNLTRERIAEGHALFPRNREVDVTRIEVLQSVISRLQSEGIVVTVILPPLPGVVVDAIAADPGHNWVEEVRDRITHASTQVLDYTDIRPIGASDCEFVDDRHAGDVANMRVLLDAQLQDANLGSFIDPVRLAEFIARFDGLALARFSPQMYYGREGDFLQIGCDKTGGTA